MRLIAALASCGLLAAAAIGVRLFSPKPTDSFGDGVSEENAPIVLPSDDTFEEPAYQADATVEEMKREALQVVDELLETHPEDSSVWAIAARLHTEFGETTAAVRAWLRCSELDPTSVEAPRALAALARARGDYEEAVAMLKTVLTTLPADAEAQAMLGHSLLQLGRIQEAVAVLQQQVASGYVLDITLLSLGQSYLQLRQWEAAEKSFQQLIELDPGEARAYYGLARVYAQRGDRQKSREYAERFRDLSTVDYDQQREEVAVYEDSAKVRQILAAILYQCGEVEFAHQAYDQAEQAWRRAAVIALDHTNCRRQMLRLFERQERLPEALDVALQLRDLEPLNPDHWLNTALLSAQCGQFDDALAAIRRAQELAPSNDRYHQARRLIEESMP